MVTPRASQMIAAPMASDAVTTIRPAISVRTGAWLTKEKPRPGQPNWSPSTRCLRNSRYCTQTGWFRPSSACTVAITAGVASLPANSTAGLTGGSTK